MEYFFGNDRNDQGLCATPDCPGKPVHLFVYEYCDRCYSIIHDLLDSDAPPIVGQLDQRTEGKADMHHNHGFL